MFPKNMCAFLYEMNIRDGILIEAHGLRKESNFSGGGGGTQHSDRFIPV